ncbi:MAG: hypothetical protein ACUVXG_01900 [Anaerolineae bacterium]
MHPRRRAKDAVERIEEDLVDGSRVLSPPSRGIWAWLVQAASGVVLVLLAGLHMLAQHFTAKGLLTYQDVVAWLARPEIFVLETVFLGAVLAHALAGVRAVLVDLGLSQGVQRWVSRMLVAVGLVLFAYAVILTWSVGHR